MHVFITGARGFVMSVFMKQLLETDPATRVTAVDITGPDELLARYLGDAGSRIQFDQLDVRDTEAVCEAISTAAPDVVVHGATVTHVPEWEQTDPVRFVDVNVMGTTSVLDAARRTPSVHRVVQVSSAAVYGTGTNDASPLPEDAPLLPDEMYGVSKVASELIAQRFSTLYGLDVPIVRFAKVFGPMERPSRYRSSMSLPFHLARSMVNGEPLTLTARSRQAMGDWISATDVAHALVALCQREESCSDNGTYNLASGDLTSVSELIDIFGATTAVGSSPGTVEVDMDPNLRYGKNGSCSIQRAADDLGWQPRALSKQVAEYLRWARDNPQYFGTKT